MIGKKTEDNNNTRNLESKRISDDLFKLSDYLSEDDLIDQSARVRFTKEAVKILKFSRDHLSDL